MKFTEFFFRQGEASKIRQYYSLPLGGKVLSESEANEGQLHIFGLLNISGEISEKQGAQFVFLYFQNFENVTAPHHHHCVAELPPKGKPMK